MPLDDDYSYDFGGKFPDEKNGGALNGALNDALNGALNEEEILLLELLCKQSSITQMGEGYLRTKGSRKKGFWVVGN